MADTTSGEGHIHDPDFYFEDGNIVLSAKYTENDTAFFRLHKSILVKHSPVFADMFAMPPPPTTDQYDGVPLVEMPDDANALRDFIAFLYDPECVPVHTRVSTIYSTGLHRRISGILNRQDFTPEIMKPTLLAKKYQVDWICNLVASQLLKRWPTTLEGWDAVNEDVENEEVRTMYGPWDPTWEDGTLTLRQFPEPVSSIRLARECGVPAVLPFAFLHLLRLPLEDEPDFPTGNPLLPSQEDWHRLALARERIGKWFSRQDLSWKDCESDTSRRCETGTLRTWCKIAQRTGRDGDFLQASSTALKNYSNVHLKDICPVCRNGLISYIMALREEFAEQLIGFFQLDDGHS